MPRANAEVAAAFNELADLLEIMGAERFKILAYRRAANSIEGLARDVRTIPPAKLKELQGIGPATSAKIQELLSTGSMKKLEEVRRAVPAGLREMTMVSGLGPKKALLVHTELGVSTVEELHQAVKENRLRLVKGLGAKSEQNIARALAARHRSKNRSLMDVAMATAEEMVSTLQELPSVVRAAYAGSLRRGKETIGDLDLLVASEDRQGVMKAFTELDAVAGVGARGESKSSVVTAQSLQVDLRVVAEDEWGAAMQYFTGSKEHNVKVRELAVKRGLKLSEYGLFTVKGNQKIAGKTEESIYEELEMQTPLPTLRENRGEVELALKGMLPEVVELADLKGDLHCHSTYSDGRASIEAMAEQAVALGLSYMAITDHGRRSHVKSLSVEDIDIQRSEIDRLNDQLGGRFTILHGVELNIGPDGQLDYPDEILRKFDLVVASVHHSLTMEATEMTARIVRGLRNPLVNILGHPTARRIGQREAIDVDLEKVFRVAAENNVALEINSNPSRLDLKDDHIRFAREFDCHFSIDSDAHTIERTKMLRLGVLTAQRAWVEQSEVINTLPLEGLRSWIGRSRSSG
ncbi:MAG TPA: DNA polymerase/3'-5' exonuclease PolX [Actinomycetota bacterium]|nr:DNA polymerase/3'-5' exonuclease PolX [Actinomycetota bacterium]